MSEREMEAKLAELDRLLNDPEVRMDPHRVWLLLQEISGATRQAQPQAQPTAVAA
ncbi:peptide chain release factor 1 [Roseomonas marmotae]|uniref:Peptide chain release factor 1 n=1 Tax=Roseomonas marmotae TaxID=2768161 RepID=A0ABS3KGL3_9PROT|nr:peptide chain release factor 1 [Roseomonas marmotae]MBO1076612.1 peptide chain release factor 1 [Roseomonas marmotae]QTI79593.1 peptide chain release factor 1 [Roseomonas marmotae]